MTWSYINQLVGESIMARTAFIRSARVAAAKLPDVVILGSLESEFSTHRYFGHPEGVIKPEPELVRDLCPTFTLPGSHARESELAFLRPTRAFIASLNLQTTVTRSNGFFRFFVSSLTVYRFFCSSFFKTRRLTFFSTALSNRQRRRLYIWRTPDFISAILAPPVNVRWVSQRIQSQIAWFLGPLFWFCSVFFFLLVAGVSR